jgi:putative Mg2+ transporter-C (MgtC) family protein
MLAWNEILIRLFLASLFGALVGLERERKDWTAGMRTHMMVCVGSSLIMMVSSFGFSDVLGREHITLDPARVAAQVISGIGFIGAGTILFLKQGTIRGLTTASGLWTVAAIGLATGGGMYFAACAATILALIILWALQPLERKFSQRFKLKTLRILTNPDIDLPGLLKRLEGNGISFSSFLLDKNEEGFNLQLKIEETNLTKLTEIIAELQKEENVKEIFWNK